MHNMRKHKRLKLDVVDISSKLSLIGDVEITDISLGGVALKTDRMLKIGKECVIMLGSEGGKTMAVKGVVTRSELREIEKRADGENATIYSAGILFKEESAEKVKSFLASLAEEKKIPVPARADWLYHGIRFSITTPGEEVLSLPAQFTIKEISQRGVIIQTGRQLNRDGMVLMELSLDSGEPVSFMGKVVSCRTTQEKGRSGFDAGVEFSELTDQDRAVLISFMERLKEG